MGREQWHLTEGLVFLHFATFILTYGSPEKKAILALFPQLVVARPWTVVTFQFIHGGMFWFFISMLVLWIMARPIEASWGSPRFLAFWLVSVLGAAGTALLLGQPLASDVFLSTSLLFTFATLFPETQFYVFFILPVKVKWLAILGGGFLLFSSLQFGLLAGVANAIGMSAGYVFFLVTRKLPSRRRLALELKKKRADMVAASNNAAVERRNADWDPQVRQAEERARAGGRVDERDLPLLDELDGAVDTDITVCAPEDFGYVADSVCRSCSGYAECAARRIRMAAEEAGGGAEGDRE
jgi:membrane associated rhomboid family serine protease